MPQAGSQPGAGGSSSAHPPPSAAGGGPARRPSAIVSELIGSLPCIRCRYDLKGLSILAHCPECGTPVRATLLAVVDPRASELQPIYRPRITAFGLVLWGLAALLAVLCAWAMWLIIVLPFGEMVRALPALRVAVLTLAALSGVSSWVLVHPHPGIPPGARRMAGAGVALYAGLCMLLWALLFQQPATARLSGPISWASTDEVRTLLGLALNVCLAAIILLLRPNARLLAARSVLLREGRVDRQTLLALASVLALATIGESMSLIGLSTQVGETILLLGQALLLASALLFTVGLVGVVVDCWRIHKVVVQPPLSFDALLEPPPSSRITKST